MCVIGKKSQTVVSERTKLKQVLLHFSLLLCVYFFFYVVFERYFVQHTYMYADGVNKKLDEKKKIHLKRMH